MKNTHTSATDKTPDGLDADATDHAFVQKAKRLSFLADLNLLAASSTAFVAMTGIAPEVLGAIRDKKPLFRNSQEVSPIFGNSKYNLALAGLTVAGVGFMYLHNHFKSKLRRLELEHDTNQNARKIADVLDALPSEPRVDRDSTSHVAAASALVQQHTTPQL